MLLMHLIDATGIAALSLNISGLVRPGDGRLLKTSGWASALWALNSLMLGAPTAAALNALSVGRQASAAVLLNRPGRLKAATFAAFVAVTLLLATILWSGALGLFAVAGSLLGTYAMFYLRGASLRWALAVVNALWLSNALVYDAFWQVAANLVCGIAAAIGAWKTRGH